MQFLRRSQCSFYAIFIVGFTLGIIGATLTQPSDHRISQIPGRAFRPRPLPENASHPEYRFRDALSACDLVGKVHPAMRARSGMQLPPTNHRENVSHSGARFRDAVSGRSAVGKAHPDLEPKSGTQFPPGAAKGKRIPFPVPIPGHAFRRHLAGSQHDKRRAPLQ